MTRPPFIRSIATVTLMLGLGACMDAVPATTNLPTPTSEREALALSLFQEFCLAPGNAAASEAAIRASGRFDAPTVSEFTTIGARYAIYALSNTTRAGVTIVTGSTGGLSCSVGVDNKGPNLFENGTVSYSG